MEATLRLLVDSLDLAKSKDMIFQAIYDFARGNGFERFAFCQIANDGVRSYNTFPAWWTQQYIRKQYCRIDPVVTRARRLKRPFRWSINDFAADTLSADQQAFRREALTQGIRSGVTAPVEGSFHTLLLLTLTSAADSITTNPFENPLHAMQVVTSIYHRFVAVGSQPFSSRRHTLTPKELIALRWAAEGKRMTEIAVIMDVRYRTVQFYIERARQKLNASNLTHAVFIARNCGLLGQA